MGQAKQRGTREDRIQQALEREAAERDARRVIEEERQAWFDGLTPEEQEAERRKHRKMSQAQLLMILAAAAGGRFL